MYVSIWLKRILLVAAESLNKDVVATWNSQLVGDVKGPQLAYCTSGRYWW